MHIFNSKNWGGKAFAAEQKIRELEKLLFKTKAPDKRLKKRIRPNKLIENATNDLNSVKSGNYSFAREQIQAKSIKSEELIEEYDFHRLKKVKQDADRSLRRDTKKDSRFKKTLREPLHIGGLVYEKERHSRKG